MVLTPLLAALANAPWTYTDLTVYGWTVKVESSEITDPVWPSVQAQLNDQLYRISRVVPDGPLAKLRKITIWMHTDDPATPCAAYHPEAGWLKDHGADPQMAHGVEIANAEHFVSWTHEQPWMLLHELAHAYHANFLPDGFDNKEIKKVWDDEMASKKYDHVLHYDGKTVKHYAETNQMEFFSECTEAYFGQNDFYPFVNAELKTFDPEAYKLMEDIWGKPVKRP
ncbi:MAG TPA: hypothetical protein VMI31_18025 [Fimbriimonadaceae bacterium]|nr:hypothetical protein [Fimbriimonadaceae bacterium]